MTILYTVICRQKDTAVLVEVCDTDIKGTFSTIMISLLQHIQQNHNTIFPDTNSNNNINTTSSSSSSNIPNNNANCRTFIQQNVQEMDFFSHFLEACSAAAVLGNENENDDDNDNVTEQHYFHIYYSKGIYYGCLSDDSNIRIQKVNFTYLMSIETEFLKTFRMGRINTAHAYSLSNQFTSTIRSSQHYYNIHTKELCSDQKVQSLIIQTEQLQKVMGRNINMILERGEKFDKLISKSNTLQQDALVFKKKSKQAKHMMQRRYYFWYIMLASILLVFFYMTLVSTCGIRLEHCRRSSSSNNSSSNTSNNNDSNSGNSSNNSNNNASNGEENMNNENGGN